MNRNPVKPTLFHMAALLCCGALIALLADNIPAPAALPPVPGDTETWVLTEQVGGETFGLLYDSALGAFRFATLAPNTQPPTVLALSGRFAITQSGQSMEYPGDRPALKVTFFQNASAAAALAETQEGAQIVSFLTWTCVFAPVGAG